MSKDVKLSLHSNKIGTVVSLGHGRSFRCLYSVLSSNNSKLEVKSVRYENIPAR